MRIRLTKMIKDEDGAVTVDWVVLTAGIIALALLLYTALESGTLGLASGIQSYLASFL